MQNVLVVFSCFFSFLLWCFSLAVPASAWASSSFKNEQIEVELLAHAPQGLLSGQGAWVGLRMKHAPNWHTYWINPGDSGLATELNWQLPKGISAGTLLWPRPEKIPVASLANYGYAHEVVLVAPLQFTPGFRPTSDSISLAVKANWLACRQECIPQSADLTLTIPASGSIISAHSTLFESTLAQQGAPIPVPATLHPSASVLTIQSSALPAAWQNQPISVFPIDAGVFDTAKEISTSWESNQWQASVPLAVFRQASPEQLSFLLVNEGSGGTQSRLLSGKLNASWPATDSAAVQTGSDDGGHSAAANSPSSAGSLLWQGMLGAFLGGLILNLMPCVFPILTIKIIGLAQLPSSVSRPRLMAGYLFGVVSSFVLLGLLLVLLRASGSALGWGFQLQSPWFIAFLILLFTLFTLNLLGIFEFVSLLPNSLANLKSSNPYMQQFLGGILAVLIASPCTAPFMGTALGAALAMPMQHGLMVFLMLGLGMALPYAVLGLFPALLRFFPKPGGWMQRLRYLIAIPIAITVAWLSWVLWAQLTAPTAGNARTTEQSIWRVWSPELETSMRQQNRPVFVNYTAAWCITCQVNERTTMRDELVLQRFAAKKVVLLKADWTNYAPNITVALQKLGRSGIPTYALYVPGQEQAQLFVEILTPAALIKALDTLP